MNLQGAGAAGPSPFPGLEGMGLGSFLQNPALMNMVSGNVQQSRLVCIDLRLEYS